MIGETDAKTEGTLQARFEKASSCSPCILLLKHIDAFAQSTQSQEPGKGMKTSWRVRQLLTESLKNPSLQKPSGIASLVYSLHGT